MSEIRIELVTTKNNRHTKNRLKVKQTITLAELEKKCKAFTKHQFKLEFHSRENDKWEDLTENALRKLLPTYNGEVINIATFSENPLDVSVISEHTPTPSVGGNSHLEPGQRQQESVVYVQVERKSLGELIIQDLQRQPNPVREGELVSASAQETDFDLTVKEIIDNFLEIALKDMNEKYQVIRQKEFQIDLGKSCSQCKKRFRGPYYLCLICKDEYILCPDCEAREIISEFELTTHKFRSHPFAKIKRSSQTIKEKKVQVRGNEDIEFTNPDPFNAVQPELQSEDEINLQLSIKFTQLYAEVLKKSEFHYRNYYNPLSLPFSSRRSENPLEPPQRQSLPEDQDVSQLEIDRYPTQQEASNAERELSDKEKSAKLKRLRRMNLKQDIIHKYTHGQYENRSYQDIYNLVKNNQS